ncbi:hypothetical protein D3C71_1375290 [compost metagenome]
MHAHNVMRPGFFTEIVEEHLRQTAQLFQMLRQLLADLHDLIRQLPHRKTMLRFLGGRKIQIEDRVE